MSEPITLYRDGEWRPSAPSVVGNAGGGWTLELAESYGENLSMLVDVPETYVDVKRSSGT